MFDSFRLPAVAALLLAGAVVGCSGPQSSSPGVSVAQSSSPGARIVPYTGRILSACDDLINMDQRSLCYMREEHERMANAYLQRGGD